MTAVMVPEHSPAMWAETELTAYRARFLANRENAEWILRPLFGAEPAAIWALADGDLGCWCIDEMR